MRLYEVIGLERALSLMRLSRPRGRTMPVGKRDPLHWVCEACGSPSHVQKPTFGTGPSVMWCEHCERSTLAHIEGKA